jgi:hypothetical protein
MSSRELPQSSLNGTPDAAARGSKVTASPCELTAVHCSTSGHAIAFARTAEPPVEPVGTSGDQPRSRSGFAAAALPAKPRARAATRISNSHLDPTFGIAAPTCRSYRYSGCRGTRRGGPRGWCGSTSATGVSGRGANRYHTAYTTSASASASAEPTRAGRSSSRSPTGASVQDVPRHNKTGSSVRVSNQEAALQGLLEALMEPVGREVRRKAAMAIKRP